MQEEDQDKTEMGGEGTRPLNGTGDQPNDSADRITGGYGGDPGTGDEDNEQTGA